MNEYRTKNALPGSFWVRIKKKTIAGFEITILEFDRLRNIVKKTKKHKFGTKNALFKSFWAGISRQYCHIRNQHPRICLAA